MSRPDSHAVWAGQLDGSDDQGEYFLPGNWLPGVFTTPSHSTKRNKEAFGVLDQFTSGSTSHTQKSPAIRILRIAFESNHVVSFHFNEHATIGWVTIHRAHGCDLTPTHYRLLFIRILVRLIWFVVH